MDVVETLFEFRKELLDLSGRVQDAPVATFSFYDEFDNEAIKYGVSQITREYLRRFSDIGYYRGARYRAAGDHEHITGTDHVYDVINLGVLDDNHIFIENHELTECSERELEFGICPCSENDGNAYFVFTKLAFRTKNFELELAHFLNEIFDCLLEADGRSEKGRPRTGIREFLLRAVMNIDKYLIINGHAERLSLL